MLRERGFTVIELLVVMAVMAILAMASFPLAELHVQREREAELKRALWEIRDAIDAYKRAADAGEISKPAGGSGYPRTLESLVAGEASIKDSTRRLYFLRRVPRDPFADPALPPERTWGLRSYQSPPERPRAGEDVYDVYSLAEGQGLSGVPLREW
ncbi:type II secretion system protein [Variovorax sp. YR752]|uniref:type II secretion system protein n=1 Tax=Variovorax sp. YR752 TaxID=1884383 RepID=UPI0031377153